MNGKILVIDPIATNRIVLRVKLAAGHYAVTQAGSLAEAMEVIAGSVPDLILCAHALPDGGPQKLMAHMRKAGFGGKIPVVVISGPGAAQDRQRLFAAGVEDVLEKPIDDMLLLARTRSVMRAYASASEWTLRDGTSRALGFAEPGTAFATKQRVRLVSSDIAAVAKWHSALTQRLNATVTVCKPDGAVIKGGRDQCPDAFILFLHPKSAPDMLGLLATIRSHAATRHSSILVIQRDPDPRLGAQMLDMGANDLMSFDHDTAELALRLETLMSRKRMSDALRDTLRSGVEAAVIDPLTGLHNRRYAIPHLARIVENALQGRKPFAVMVADMDHFKRINDTMGHAAGDAVLVETARRLRDNLRAVDLIARIGGEEFLIVLPGADLDNAQKAAHRLCRMIRNTPYSVPDQDIPIKATISIGMTVCDPMQKTTTTRPMNAQALLERADKALYGAKAEGRDRVTLSRPAA